jgi:hypothetical protein
MRRSQPIARISPGSMPCKERADWSFEKCDCRKSGQVMGVNEIVKLPHNCQRRAERP